MCADTAVIKAVLILVYLLSYMLTMDKKDYMESNKTLDIGEKRFKHSFKPRNISLIIVVL